MSLPDISPGFDLVENARMAMALERGGKAFLQRTFTEAEVAYCQGFLDTVPRFAARFAAKEAVAKAFRTGTGEAPAFREIEVVVEAHGAPVIHLHGAAAATSVAHPIPADPKAIYQESNAPGNLRGRQNALRRQNALPGVTKKAG